MSLVFIARFLVCPVIPSPLPPIFRQTLLQAIPKKREVDSTLKILTTMSTTVGVINSRSFEMKATTGFLGKLFAKNFNSLK